MDQLLLMVVPDSELLSSGSVTILEGSELASHGLVKPAAPGEPQSEVQRIRARKKKEREGVL